VEDVETHPIGVEVDGVLAGPGTRLPPVGVRREHVGDRVCDSMEDLDGRGELGIDHVLGR
jgi:hypothetical protein